MFKTRQIKTQILGEKLKSARETMKLSLWQASKKTKIPLDYLEFIENGNYGKLPADVYVTAYLRRYAELLNLDADEILNQFRAECGVAVNLCKAEPYKKLSKPIRGKPFLILTPKRAGLIAGIIVISVIFGYFWHQLSYLIYPPAIRLTNPSSDLTTREKSIEVLGRTESDVYLTINGKEVYVDKEGYFSSVVDLESGLNILKIEAKDRAGKTNTVIRRIIVTQ